MRLGPGPGGDFGTIQIAFIGPDGYQDAALQRGKSPAATNSKPMGAGRMIRNTTASWGSVARGFHWGLAAAIIGMIAFGWWMNHIPARPDRFFYRSIHADIGYVVLLLTLLRLVWRGVNPTPVLPEDTSRWHRIAARVSHAALYVVAILVAVLGWAHSGARTPDYSDWFGLFHVPQITSPDRAAAQAYEQRH